MIYSTKIVTSPDPSIRDLQKTIEAKDREISRLDSTICTMCDEIEKQEELIYTLEKERDLVTVSNVALRDDIVRLESKLLEQEEPETPHRNLQTMLGFCHNEKASLVAEVSALKTELGTKAEEILNLKKDIDSVNAANLYWESICRELEEELEEKKDLLEAWCDDSKRWMEYSKELEEDAETLMSSSEELQEQAAQVAAEFEKMKNENRVLAENLAIYKTAWEDYTRDIEELSREKGEAEEYADLLRTIYHNDTEAIKGLGAEIDKLEKEKEALEQQLETFCHNFSVDTKIIRTLEEQIEELEEENRLSTVPKEQLVETCRGLQDRVGELCEDKGYLQSKIYHLERKLARLESRRDA